MSISQDRVERLKEIGFKWIVIDYDEANVKRCFELEVFKNKFGHCNVPCKYSANPPLGSWCDNMRTAYNKIQKGERPRHNISRDRIERLERIGFKWLMKRHQMN